jgi:hypothetical protein
MGYIHIFCQPDAGFTLDKVGPKLADIIPYRINGSNSGNYNSFKWVYRINQSSPQATPQGNQVSQKGCIFK